VSRRSTTLAFTGPQLTSDERAALSRALEHPTGPGLGPLRAALPSLKRMIEAALRTCEARAYTRHITLRNVLYTIIRGALHLDRPPALWTLEDWLEVKRTCAGLDGLATMVVAVEGYGVLSSEPYHPLYRSCSPLPLARRLFGQARVDDECTRLHSAMARLGYRQAPGQYAIPRTVAELLIWHGAPTLDVVTDESIARFAQSPPSRAGRRMLLGVSAGLVELGILSRRIEGPSSPRATGGPAGVPAEWLGWCKRWEAASTLSQSSRSSVSHSLNLAGRWLARCHPTITSPVGWTIDTAHDWVRYVTDRRLGDDAAELCRVRRPGEPGGATHRIKLIAAVRIFFRDLLDWELIERRFDPFRALRVPRDIRRAVGPNPRPIDDAFWLKLRTAALNFGAADMPIGGKGRTSPVPAAMARAIAVAWVFSGCRGDEIRRLHLDCIYMEDVPEQVDTSTGEVSPAFRQAMLRVPAGKTRGEFVKPVEMPLAEAIEIWRSKRPEQPKQVDRVTRQLTDYLFCIRGRKLGKSYINITLIPALLRKGGLPSSDSRGPITGHRSRSTLATKLYSPSSGMAAVEVMEWLGHTDLTTGRYYLDLTPVRLMKAFRRNVQLSENLRFVNVLADSNPTPGDPVLRYDLGHGWCTNPAFAMCAHRMACARCSFYEPAEAMRERLAQQEGRYFRLLQELQLADDERAAISGDADAVQQLLVRLKGEPTPDHRGNVYG